MECHKTAVASVRDLDAQSEYVAKLPLERRKIRIDGLRATRAGRTRRRYGARLLASGTFFRLPNREALRNYLTSQGLWVSGCRDGTCVAHADFASQ